MPIDRDKALANPPSIGEGSYGRDDVILYHLGLGAGDPPTDPGELEYTYEKNLKVLPTFAVVANSGRQRRLTDLEGVDFNPALMLHGEQEILIHEPLPVESKLRGESRIAEIYDKGKAALLVMESKVSGEQGQPLYTSRVSLFLRGEGGFGGPSGGRIGNEPPERSPDGVIEKKTLPQQALLYRLNGDKNPLHADPEFAARAGFERPILHGLCSYGIVCKAIVDAVFGGDTSRVARYQARFAGVAFPGETYRISWWQEGGRVLIAADSKDRDGAKIISNAVIEARA